MDAVTNIIAAVSVFLITNRTERFSDRTNLLRSPMPSRVENYRARKVTSADPNPTNKWVSVRVVEVTELSFDWHGLKKERHYNPLSIVETEHWLVSSNVWMPKPPPEQRQTTGFMSLFPGRVRNGTNSLDAVTGHIDSSNRLITIRISDTNDYKINIER